MSFQDKIRDPKCKKCALHKGAKYRCLMGVGSKKAKIMIVGEAPGEREDEAHQAFVGPAGRLLNDLLNSVGFERSDCYITNVAKCRPEDNRTPERSEVKTCVESYFAREWNKVRPEFVLVLGNSALQGVLGKSGITKHRGTVFPYGGAQVLPTFHPAYALRSPRNLPPLRADFQRFARLVRSEQSPTGRTKIKSIRTPEQLKWLKRHLLEAKEISWDVESNYDHATKQYYPAWHPDFKLVSIAFSTREGESLVVPLHHGESPWKDPVGVLRFLKPCLERADAKYIGHNGKFDVRATAGYGKVFIPQTFDTMLAAHMLNENRLKGLKPLSEIDLGADGYGLDKEKMQDLYNQPWRDVALYNGKDTDYTLRLKHVYTQQLKKEPRLARVFMNLMMPASNMLSEVEATGIYMDPERLSDRYEKALKQLARIQRYIGSKGAKGINLNSPQQVAAWLFGTLGLPIIEKTPKGAPSTREAVVLRLAREEPAVRALLLYRQWAKYESTYLRPWLQTRDSGSRFHANYKPHGTVTGRLSGDFQQVPRDPFIRSIVGAPPGWKLVKADYSQVELRIAAMLAHERNMLRVFHEGGDIHLATAVAVTGKRPGDITPEERKKAKAVNFGFLYGMGWLKFVAYAFENYGVIVSEADARRFRDRYFEMWPALRAWHEKQRRLVRKYGYVTSPIGRVRHLPDAASGDRVVKAEAERQAINSPVQSTASDLMLTAMVRLNRELPKRKALIVATIHDEILFQVRDDFVDEACSTIKSTMEDMDYVYDQYQADITVPIVAELAVGQHWGEQKEWVPS